MSTRSMLPIRDCQHGVDIKALKGKDAREVERLYEATIADMLELANTTKSVRTNAYVLEIHRRAKTGQVSLRWRESFGGWCHVKWEDENLQQGLMKMAPDWRSFYSNINENAARLNEREKALRMELRSLRRRLR